MVSYASSSIVPIALNIGDCVMDMSLENGRIDCVTI